MVLAVIHDLRPNQNLKEILEGCANLNHLWGSSNLFSQAFFRPQCVYIRFTHIMNMQPKFYIVSAMHHTLDREYSLSRNFLQLTNGKLVQAELALRFWKEHNNLYVWAPIPLFAERTDYRCLELAIIQERQHLPVFPPSQRHSQETCHEHQCTVWPCHTLATGQTQIHSTGGQRHLGLGSNRLELWTIIHASGLWDQTLRPASNKLKCFDPARVVSPWAIHYVGWPTRFRSPIAHCPSRPSMPPFDGGGESPPHVLLH